MIECLPYEVEDFHLTVEDVIVVSHESGYYPASPEMSQNLHLHAGSREFESLIAHMNFPL